MIRTERLLLHRFRESDCDDLFEFLSQLEDDEFEGYPGITWENGREYLRQNIYFRKDADGNFMWPGFGDNLRVLDWIIDRCEGKVDADETAIGYLPKADDINLEGLEGEVTLDSLKSILDVDKDLWKNEVAGIEEFYQKFGDTLPAELKDCLATLKSNLE